MTFLRVAGLLLVNESSRTSRRNGSIDKYKAKLVIRVFDPKKGIDYFDTYSLVTKITTIKILLTLAARHGLVLH